MTTSSSSATSVSTLAVPGSGDDGSQVVGPPSGTRIPIWIPFVVLVVVIFAAIPVIIVVVRKRKKRLMEKEAMKLEREAKKKKRMEKREKGRLRKRLDAFFSRKRGSRSKPKQSDEKVEAQLEGAKIVKTSSSVKKSVGTSGKGEVKVVQIEIQSKTGKSSIKAKSDSRVKKPEDAGAAVQGEAVKSSVKAKQESKEGSNK